MKGIQSEGRFSDISPQLSLTVNGWPLRVESEFTYWLSESLYDKLGDMDRMAFKDGVHVPGGFTTDLASVPKVFTRIFPPYGRYSMPAIVHDYLYSPYCRYNCSRKAADQIFLDAMIDRGVDLVTRRSLYSAVRVGGWVPWNKAKNGE